MVKFHFTHIRVIAWPPFQKTSLLTKDDKHLSISGRYFAKPQIKEYEFEPKHELLELVEGQTGQVKGAYNNDVTQIWTFSNHTKKL